MTNKEYADFLIPGIDKSVEDLKTWMSTHNLKVDFVNISKLSNEL